MQRSALLPNAGEQARGAAKANHGAAVCLRGVRGKERADSSEGGGTTQAEGRAAAQAWQASLCALWQGGQRAAAQPKGRVWGISAQGQAMSRPCLLRVGAHVGNLAVHVAGHQRRLLAGRQLLSVL